MVELITSLIVSAIFVLLLNQLKKSENSNPRKLPPGPRPLPIIGNLHQISNPPFRCFRDLSKPVRSLNSPEARRVHRGRGLVARARQKNAERSRPLLRQRVVVDIMWYHCSDIAFGPYGDYWRQMRKLCTNELLSFKMVRLFQSIQSDETARLVRSLHESSGTMVNLTEKIFSLTSYITCRAACGCVSRDNETLVKLIVDTAEMLSGFHIADLFPSLSALSFTRRRLRTMWRKLDVILDDVIYQHKRLRNSEFGSEELIHVLLRVQEEEQLQFPIGNDNIKAVLYDVFTAGTDTSAATIDWAMVELLRHPQVMAKAQAEVRHVLTNQNDVVHELEYLKLVIKETLRLHPPTPLLPRACKEEIVINGYTIRAGEKVLVIVWAMHRDLRYWKELEKFNPERFENQYLDFLGGDFQFLPFGAGKRMCPGITFGLATMEFTLSQLLYNFDWKLPEGVEAEDLDMIENNGMAVARKQNLFFVVTPYNTKLGKYA